MCLIYALYWYSGSKIPPAKYQKNKLEKIQICLPSLFFSFSLRFVNIGSFWSNIRCTSPPIVEAHRDQSSLLRSRFSFKIYCGALSIEKDKYLAPAHNLKATRGGSGIHYSLKNLAHYSSH